MGTLLNPTCGSLKGDLIERDYIPKGPPLILITPTIKGSWSLWGHGAGLYRPKKGLLRVGFGAFKPS